MKKLYIIVATLITTICSSQDISMQNGTFNRCSPDKFFDSGGEFGNYGDNQNLVTTICPQNSDEFIILNFTLFTTQLGLQPDIMNIYDGDDTSANLLGTFSGTNSPDMISATNINTSGCLTIEFISSDGGNLNGWEAEILCATPCQAIFAEIENTVPLPNDSGVIGILPGESVNFSGSATFSDDGTNATYDWNFGDGNTAAGTNVSNTFASPGTYIVTLTVTDDNPQGCLGTDTITVFVLGGNVVIDQDTFTVQQLVEEVLVNSTCAAVTNITSSTGSDFSSNEPNGIGYFFGDGQSFPFAEGILLTTGDASQARGPNNNGTLGEGTSVWEGDTELDAELGVDSHNATFIQFDFTPLADNISFEFLMASEEYDMGIFECTYSDAFAFLLTDSSGNTTNLAVLPNTTTPILVTNIHPDNGASCGGSNEQYFGAYTPYNQPPIAFDGRTAVFTAQSAVIPGDTYTIKLIIADDRDNDYDSGVFLKAGSFDLGGDLGDDITIAQGTAECGGISITLDTGVPLADHVWYYAADPTMPFDRVEIEGETSSVLTVTEPGIYSVDVVFTGVCQSSDSVLVEFKYSPTANQANNLIICDTDGTSNFNLSENDIVILDGQNSSDFIISYHFTEQDAIDNVGALPNTYTNISNPQTIWARIGDMTQECYDITSFSINSIPKPTLNPAMDLEQCDDLSNDGFEEFDLSTQSATILGIQPSTDYNVSYYLSASEAESGTNALPTLYTNNVNPEPIYARVENNGDSSCYNASAVPVFNLVVHTRAIANTPLDIEVCDDLSNDGIATFNLSSQELFILGGQDPNIYDVSFHMSQNDADTNTAALATSHTNSTPNLETIYVRVEDPLHPDCYSTTSFDLVVNTLPAIMAPTALEVCDDGTPDGLTEMDLSVKDAEITSNNPNYTVSYYESLAEASSATNPLPTLYTNTSNGQVIYVRLEDNDTGCYDTTSLELIVEQAPIAFTPEPLRYCDPDNDGFGMFSLTDADNEITGGSTGLTVSYHETFVNAEDNLAAIDTTSDYGNFTIHTQTLYARVESATITTDCATIVELQLIVEPTPQLVEPTALEACDDISADGYAVFNLTDSNTELLNGQDPTQYTVSYYTTQANAEAADNPITNPTGYTNTEASPQTIWIRVEDSATVEGCYKVTSLELRVNPLPVLTQPSPLELCDVNNPGDEREAFNLEEVTTDILNGQTGISLSYYETQADAENATSPIASPYTNTSTVQTVFVRAENVATGCYETIAFTIRVNPVPTPTPSEQLPDLELCDDINSGDGVEAFDLTQNEVLILNGETVVTPTYHESAEDAESGVNPIPDPTQYINTGTPVQEIYVRVTNIFTDCYVVVDFAVIVHPLPEVVAVTDFIQCELNTDGFDTFDLTSKNAEVLNGQSPTEFAVSYHESVADAESGANDLVSPYNNLSNPQQIFVTITNLDTGCSISTQSFNIQVDEAAEANADMDPILYEQCDDNMETDGNPSNDSVQFDLTTQDAEVLDGQDATNYVVTYYATEEDANLNINPLPTLYENITNPQVIYARVDNDTPDITTGADTSICYAVATLTLEVDPLPEFDLEDSYILCVNTNGTDVLDPLVLDTGLSVIDYSFEWSYNGTVIPTETSASMVPTAGGNYSVSITNNLTGCTNTDTTAVVESEPPMLEVNLVTQAFADNHVIEALATGIGVYEYSLDGGPWQDEGTFSNVSSGAHEITARDKNGCGMVSEPIFVIDYPMYFTPNGDGNNDTWNIPGVGSSAKIYIFDRYGKLLKQLSPTGQGWNGTFNGSMMPTSDYWFMVEYNEPLTDKRKEFKAHFTLKR